MIKSLKIKNFQSHKDTRLDFHPGVNVIQGKSTTGKTAIIRALLLLATNRPTGFRYHSNFSDKKGLTEVEIQIPEAKITFLKKKDRSTYIVDGEEYSGFGTGMPDVVESKLNLSELNVSKQLDPHFLVTSPPGQVAKILNKITHIDEVDLWVSKLTTKINSTNKEASLLKGQCEEITQQLESYTDLDEANLTLSEIEKLNVSLSLTKNKIESLTGICSNYSGIEQAIEENEHVLLCDSELEELDSLFVEYDNTKYMIDLFESFTELTSRIDKLEIVTEAENDLESIMDSNASLDPLVKEIRLVKSVLRDISSLVENIKVASLIYKRRKKDYGDALVSLKICPLCFSEIGIDVVELILKEL